MVAWLQMTSMTKYMNSNRTDACKTNVHLLHVNRVFLPQCSSAENTRLDSSISVNNGLAGMKNNDRSNSSVFIFATT